MQAIDAAGRFLDQWGSLAVEFGWTPGDLFDVPRDGGLGGLVWFLQGETVRALGPEHAVTQGERILDKVTRWPSGLIHLKAKAVEFLNHGNPGVRLDCGALRNEQRRHRSNCYFMDVSPSRFFLATCANISCGIPKHVDKRASKNVLFGRPNEISTAPGIAATYPLRSSEPL